MAALAADPDAARAIFETAISLYEQLGDTHAAARVTGAAQSRKHDRPHARSTSSDGARVRGHLARRAGRGDSRCSRRTWQSRTGEPGVWSRALERAEFALDISEAHGYMEADGKGARRERGSRSQPWASRGDHRARRGEGLAIALENDLLEQANTYYFWLSDFSFHRDRYADALRLPRSGRRARTQAWQPAGRVVLFSQATYALAMTGRWDEAVEASEQLSDEQARSGGMFLEPGYGAARDSPSARKPCRGAGTSTRSSNISMARWTNRNSPRTWEQPLRLPGRKVEFADALDAGRKATETRGTLRLSHQCVEQGLVEALEASVALGEPDVTRQLLALIEEQPLGQRPPFLDAQAHRFHGQARRRLCRFRDRHDSVSPSSKCPSGSR